MPKHYYTTENYNCRQSIGYLLRRGRTLLTSQVETMFEQKFADRGITFVHWVILICLRDGLARTPSEISQYICYDSGALTRVIDQMEKGGLIKRERSEEDRRVVELKLLPGGLRMIDSLIGIVVDFYNGMLEDFTHAETEMLLILLTRLVTKLDNTRTEA